jgi:hypothetical protein
MSEPQLGRLVTVHPRDVWPHEAQAFTPWLLANVDVLADLLGMELELEVAEHPVGGFSLDLLGRDLSDDSVVIVENQLEQSDHGHLGQILTYAAGTDPRTIVWISTGFRPEHRAALDWLNEHTDPDVRFFGIEIQVVKIGTSEPAPNFKLAAQPNDWGKRVRAAAATTGLSERSQLYWDFWEQFLSRITAEYPDWTRAKATTTNSWYDLPTGHGALVYSTAFTRTGLRVQLYFSSSNTEVNQSNYERVAQQKAAFESALGELAQWDDKPGKKAAAIFVTSPFRTVEATARWTEMLDWIVDQQMRFRNAFQAVGGPAAFR